MVVHLPVPLPHRADIHPSRPLPIYTSPAIERLCGPEGVEMRFLRTLPDALHIAYGGLCCGSADHRKGQLLLTCDMPTIFAGSWEKGARLPKNNLGSEDFHTRLFSYLSI